MNISVAGLGKLGAVLAGVLADRGHQVIGVDLNPAAVDAFNQGRSPVSEPGLDQMIRASASRLAATSDIATAVAKTDITFILVPSPSQADGTFSLKAVLSVTEGIGRALRQKPAYHLVVVTTTVMPGSTGGAVLPLLEQTSGKKCGPDFGLCYNPEFIALGSVIEDMSHPDMLLIGESDARAGSMLEELYHTVCRNRPPVARMNFVNAELAKISVNTFVTTKISYANMLAEICEKVPGADSEVVGAAIGLDTRIGRKYLKGAVGYGGPCFPRDNTAFARFAELQSVDATLAKATDLVNRRQVTRLAERITAVARPGEPVGILGLSYKPDTEVIEQSQGLMLAAHLLAAGYPVVVYDPAAMNNARGVLDGRVQYAASMEECAGQVLVLVIATPWKQFQSLRPEHLRPSSQRPVIVDWWRILPREIFEAATEYIACGRGPSPARAAQALRAADGLVQSV